MVRTFTPASRWAAVALLALVFGPEPALAAPVELVTEASVGVGYDSNLYLSAAALPTDLAGTSGSFVALRPFVLGALVSRSGHRLTLSYALDARQYVGSTTDGETTTDQRAVLGYASAPFGGFQLELELSLSHLYFRQLDGAGWFGAGGEVSLSRALGSALIVEAGYAPTTHQYSQASSARRDVLHRLFIEARWSPVSGLTLSPHYAFTLADSDPDELDSSRHTAGLAVTYRPARVALTMVAGYDVALLALASAVSRTNPQGRPLPSKPAERTDLIHQPFAEVRWQVTRWLALAASYRLVIGRSDVEENYSRHVALGVVRFSFDLGGGAAAGGGAGPRQARRGHISSAGNVTFAAAPGDARSMAVVGSFNGWDPQRGRMTRGADGRWRLALDLPAGNHRYMLWVDGKIVAPPRCERWVADGFGSRNCVVSVGRRPNREAAR